VGRLPHEPAPATPAVPASAIDRARTRWGIDRVALLHAAEALEEADLARGLQRHLRHLPVVMLHDRRLPDGTVAAFLAAGPGGLTVIVEAGRVVGPLRAERMRGMFGRSRDVLRDGAGADRSALLDRVGARVAAVRTVVGDDAMVTGALCLGPEVAAEALRPLHVGSLVVGSPRAIARLCARDGRLTDTEVAALVDALAAACPPAYC
jgi:hypothetical protein